MPSGAFRALGGLANDQVFYTAIPSTGWDEASVEIGVMPALGGGDLTADEAVWGADIVEDVLRISTPAYAAEGSPSTRKVVLTVANDQHAETFEFLVGAVNAADGSGLKLCQAMPVIEGIRGEPIPTFDLTESVPGAEFLGSEGTLPAGVVLDQELVGGAIHYVLRGTPHVVGSFFVRYDVKLAAATGSFWLALRIEA